MSTARAMIALTIDGKEEVIPSKKESFTPNTVLHSQASAESSLSIPVPSDDLSGMGVLSDDHLEEKVIHISPDNPFNPAIAKLEEIIRDETSCEGYSYRLKIPALLAFSALTTAFSILMGTTKPSAGFGFMTGVSGMCLLRTVASIKWGHPKLSEIKDDDRMEFFISLRGTGFSFLSLDDKSRLDVILQQLKSRRLEWEAAPFPEDTLPNAALATPSLS